MFFMEFSECYEVSNNEFEKSALYLITLKTCTDTQDMMRSKDKLKEVAPTKPTVSWWGGGGEGYGAWNNPE